MSETPLVWTSKGNLPEEKLVAFDNWEVTPTYIKHTYGYTLDGEIVKQSVAVRTMQGLQTIIEQGTFGG